MMKKLPADLTLFCDKFWPHDNVSASSREYDKLDITVVTAFFDLGRAKWEVQGGGRSPFQRSIEDYFTFFGFMARLKNPMVIFVAPEHAARVLELRKAAGLDERTTIYTIANLFELPAVETLVQDVQSKLTPDFRRWTRFPTAPEYNYPHYVVLDALKSIFVTAAIAAGAVPTQQAAWLDFGYCRDEKCFDQAKPWRFDTGGLMNIFHMRPIDDIPIFKVVQRGYVYFQGGCKIGPVNAWPAFAAAIDDALDGLITADLVDDEQTLVFMAWRANPKLYKAHPMDRRDWRVAIRFFNEDMQGEDVRFNDYRLANSLREHKLIAWFRSAATIIARAADKFV